MNTRLTAAAISGVLALPLGIAAAAPASASAVTTAHFQVVCSAVNVRTHPTTSSPAVGVGYKGDPMAVTKGLLPKGTHEFTWLYGSLTRLSDHQKVTGWAIASCVR